MDFNTPSDQTAKQQIEKKAATPGPIFSDAFNEPVSFSGSDILCLIHIPPTANTQSSTEIEDQLQTITVTSARSVMPVRRLGETSPIAYTRGSRTIAGSMVFTTSLRDAFLSYFAKKSVADGEPLREPTIFVDQIPKFDMIFQGLNEVKGVVSQAILKGITLTNFGTTFSIDDIYTESTFTYVAEQYFPMAVDRKTTSSLRNSVENLTNQMKRAVAEEAPEPDAKDLLSIRDYTNGREHVDIMTRIGDRENRLIVSELIEIQTKLGEVERANRR